VHNINLDDNFIIALHKGTRTGRNILIQPTIKLDLMLQVLLLCDS